MVFRNETLPEATVYEILANRRRRETIQRLSETGEPVALGSLAEAIAASETGESPPPRALRESVYNSLHQTHLPKLDELGVLTYDREAREVALRERARDVHLYMEVVTSHGLTWSEIYRTLGVCSLTLVVATLADVPVVATVDPLVWATLSLVTFVVATTSQLWANRWYYLRTLRE